LENVISRVKTRVEPADAGTSTAVTQVTPPSVEYSSGKLTLSTLALLPRVAGGANTAPIRVQALSAVGSPPSMIELVQLPAVG